MFNKGEKERAIRMVKAAARDYNNKVEMVTAKSTELFEIRRRTGEEIIKPVEDFINSLANTPKEFEKTFTKFKFEYTNFNNKIYELELEAKSVDNIAKGSAVGGVVAGVGAAALLPTGAMAVATTFGVASTGTAIATLSGAAATNAALAWLGGGALLAGGGGMAAGSALLALAGPIGWGIAGAGIIGGGIFANSKNKKITEEANDQRYEIQKGINKIQKGIIKVENITARTIQHNSGIKDILNILKNYAPNDYTKYNQHQKQLLATLINNIHSLAELIKETAAE